MKEMKDKQVLIVGMARSGVAAARMLSRLGAKLTLTDTRNSEQMASAIEQLRDIDANWQLGVEPDALIEGKDYIILSPSVYYWAPWVEKAKQNGTETPRTESANPTPSPSERTPATGYRSPRAAQKSASRCSGASMP